MSSVPYVQSLFNFSLLSRAPRTILQCFFGNNLKFFMLNNKLLMFKLLLEKILTIGFILVNFQGAVQTVVGLIQSPFLLFYLVYRFYILLLTCLCDSRKEDRDVVRLQLQNYYFRYQQEHLSVQIRSNEKLYNYRKSERRSLVKNLVKNYKLSAICLQPLKRENVFQIYNMSYPGYGAVFKYITIIPQTVMNI